MFWLKQTEVRISTLATTRPPACQVPSPIRNFRQVAFKAHVFFPVVGFQQNYKLWDVDLNFIEYPKQSLAWYIYQRWPQKWPYCKKLYHRFPTARNYTIDCLAMLHYVVVGPLSIRYVQPKFIPKWFKNNQISSNFHVCGLCIFSKLDVLCINTFPIKMVLASVAPCSPPNVAMGYRGRAIQPPKEQIKDP